MQKLKYFENSNIFYWNCLKWKIKWRNLSELYEAKESVQWNHTANSFQVFIIYQNTEWCSFSWTNLHWNLHPQTFSYYIVISNFNHLQLHYGIVYMCLFIMWQRFHYRSPSENYYWGVWSDLNSINVFNESDAYAYAW